MVADGYGLVTETLIMRRYWTHVCKRIATLSEAGPDWWGRIDESELRQWAMVWLRAQSACRPQDLYGLLDGIELFSHTSWLDSTQVTLWFWGGKDTKSTTMNQHHNQLIYNSNAHYRVPVSYTHLTLPTILRV